VGDQISIRPGFDPWRPGPGADLVRTYNYYDMPLVGLIQQSGVLFLFGCLEGQAETENLWAYSLVGDREVEELEANLSSPEKFGSVAREIFSTRPIVVAVAEEGSGIRSSALIEDPQKYSSLLDASIEIFHSIGTDLEHFRFAAPA
jgi:hypothetical protein